MHRAILPEGWVQPKGYANGVLAQPGQTLYVGGQIGWNSQAVFESDDFVHQVRQSLENVKAILQAAGAGPEHMTRMTWYITNKEEYTTQLRDIGQAYRSVMGKNFPSMSVVQVVALVEDRAKVEIEVTAVF